LTLNVDLVAREATVALDGGSAVGPAGAHVVRLLFDGERWHPASP
jgi:hypothetical protein